MHMHVGPWMNIWLLYSVMYQREPTTAAWRLTCIRLNYSDNTLSSNWVETLLLAWISLQQLDIHWQHEATQAQYSDYEDVSNTVIYRWQLSRKMTLITWPEADQSAIGQSHWDNNAPQKQTAMPDICRAACMTSRRARLPQCKLRQRQHEFIAYGSPEAGST